MVKSGVKVRFSGAGDRLTINFRFRLAQVAVNAGATGIIFLTSNTGAGTGVSQDIVFFPAAAFYFPIFVTTLFNLFELYKLNAARIQYEPRINTSSTASFVIAAPEDPMWPDSHGQLTAGKSTPTETSLTSLEDSCTVVSYGKCDLNIPCNSGRAKEGMLYTAGFAGGSALNYSTTPTSVIRDCAAGILLIAGTPGNQAASTVLGDVYCEMSMTLKEFTITQNTAVAFSQPRIRHWVPERDEGKFVTIWGTNPEKEKKLYVGNLADTSKPKSEQKLEEEEYVLTRVSREDMEKQTNVFPLSYSSHSPAPRSSSLKSG